MAAKPLTKSQIIDALAKAVGTTKKQASTFLEALVTLSYKEAKKSFFVIPGLGKLILVQRKRRLGRNPRTGESMVIPAKKVLKFRISKQAKDAILPPKK